MLRVAAEAPPSTVAMDDEMDPEYVEASSLSRGGRRNKRKMTEPRRRATTDFSIRSICSSSNSDVDVDVDDDDGNDDDMERGEFAGKSKRMRTELPSKKPDDNLLPSVRSFSDSDQLNLAVSKAAAAAAAAAAAFEQTKSFMFYPLNIPMVYCAPSVIPNAPPGSFVASALSSAAAYRSMFDTPPAAMKSAADAAGVRRRSPVIDADIPSPTKDDDDDDQQSLLRRPDDDEEGNDSALGSGLSHVTDKRIPRRKRRQGGGGRRASSTVAAPGSLSVSPNESSDGSPVHRNTITSVERLTVEVIRRNSSGSAAASVDVEGGPSRASSPLRKNYKNMTKQRRIEANARERTRVHTISAAFESLRRAVPSYSYNQRLSKLAILRIACSYILALAKLADLDYGGSREGSGGGGESLTFADCVDLCTQTIQTEGKAKRRH